VTFTGVGSIALLGSFLLFEYYGIGMALAILHGHDQENLLLLFQFFFGSLHPVAGEGTNNTCRLGLQMGYFGRIRENLSECLVELPSMPCPFALRRFERISRGATEREQQGEEQDESIHVVFFCLTLFRLIFLLFLVFYNFCGLRLNSFISIRLIPPLALI